jgi:hypothetical protein
MAIYIILCLSIANYIIIFVTILQRHISSILADEQRRNLAVVKCKPNKTERNSESNSNGSKVNNPNGEERGE